MSGDQDLGRAEGMGWLDRVTLGSAINVTHSLPGQCHPSLIPGNGRSVPHPEACIATSGHADVRSKILLT